MNDEKSLEILDTVQEVGFILRYFFLNARYFFR